MPGKRSAGDFETEEVPTVHSSTTEEASSSITAIITPTTKKGRTAGKKAEAGVRMGKISNDGAKRAKITKKEGSSVGFTAAGTSTDLAHTGTSHLTPEDQAILARYEPDANTPWTEDSSALLLALYHANPSTTVAQAQQELNSRLGYKKKQVENKLSGFKKKESKG
ncbi:hypothetical protein HK097_011193 [Rhizophlyctis rosea]|uniref:Uncharacterized protein n=1 Tax=Rhizophlyctis rosea TaxID=64517 RepID=A0AAD5SKM5_9FUNG|nr:hypothetical protein HK097_011193 [Rhizophlyctis rosea]